ncbi:MAG: helix-turn-helix domain-containing protein [Cytophagales bacterium]|nr:helix-turn-helix domain-containing protein [Cytophagales bacterium]
MEVICLEEDAFFALVERVVDRLEEKRTFAPDTWIDGTEAMRMLGIKALSTLQGLRDEGKIRFTKPSKKIILYDRNSINEYLDQYAKDTF